MASRKMIATCITTLFVLAVSGAGVPAFPPHPRQSERQTIKVITVSDEEMLAYLAKQFKDPKGQFADMKRKAGERQQAISEFVKKVNRDEKLFMTVKDSPLKAFKDRDLLGPLDKLSFDYTNLDELFRGGPGRYLCYWEIEFTPPINACVDLGPNRRMCYVALPLSVRQICVPR